ncbi:MAG TPA: DUF5946 family protein [Chthoniobacterales bacterium]
MNHLEAYHELCAYTLTHGDAAFIHQHVVDAYCAQNATRETKPIAITFALLGLCLHAERSFNGRQVQLAHMHLAREKRTWPTFNLPDQRGSITTRDVIHKTEGAERDAAISEWAMMVWQAYACDPATAASVRRLCDEVMHLAPHRRNEKALG